VWARFVCLRTKYRVLVNTITNLLISHMNFLLAYQQQFCYLHSTLSSNRYSNRQNSNKRGFRCYVACACSLSLREHMDIVITSYCQVVKLKRVCIVHTIKEAITQFAVTRNWCSLLLLSSFCHTSSISPKGRILLHSFLPALTLTANLIPCPHPPYLYGLF
jgi:hypothetical protein